MEQSRKTSAYPDMQTKRPDAGLTTHLIHYLFGLGGLVSSLVLAISNKTPIQETAAISSIVCILLFAYTKPDLSFSQLGRLRRVIRQRLSH